MPKFSGLARALARTLQGPVRAHETHLRQGPETQLCLPWADACAAQPATQARQRVPAQAAAPFLWLWTNLPHERRPHTWPTVHGPPVG
eukprot:6474818-Amphidinium_carterae.1